MTGIRRRNIRVLTWTLGIFNFDACVTHENQQINLIGPFWQADRFKLDKCALSGEMEKEFYDQEFVSKNTFTTACDWLSDEFNCDTIKKNHNWMKGPSNREMHAMNGNRDTVTIISANMTCWAKHAETVLAMKADALVLQETRLNRLMQVRASRKAAFQGYDVVWGQGMKQMKTRIRGNNLVGNETLRKSTMYGGVGILANQKTLPGLLAAGTKDGAAATLAESGRYVRAAIPLQHEGRKQFLHITNMYLEPQFDTPAQARKERMMKLALEDIAKLGDQAALICVDQNCSSMAIMEAAIEAGDWVDLGKRFAIGDPEPTYGRGQSLGQSCCGTPYVETRQGVRQRHCSPGYHEVQIDSSYRYSAASSDRDQVSCCSLEEEIHRDPATSGLPS